MVVLPPAGDRIENLANLPLYPLPGPSGWVGELARLGYDRSRRYRYVRRAQLQPCGPEDSDRCCRGSSKVSSTSWQPRGPLTTIWLERMGVVR
jgi:hypothetical protein